MEVQFEVSVNPSKYRLGRPNCRGYVVDLLPASEDCRRHCRAAEVVRSRPVGEPSAVHCCPWRRRHRPLYAVFHGVVHSVSSVSTQKHELNLKANSPEIFNTYFW